MSQDNEAQWTEHAKQILEGRKVVEVRYMDDEEAASFDWHERPLLIIFDDNTVIFASSDDEGNGGGALFGQSDAMNELVIPAMRVRHPSRADWHCDKCDRLNPGSVDECLDCPEDAT